MLHMEQKVSDVAVPFLFEKVNKQKLKQIGLRNVIIDRNLLDFSSHAYIECNLSQICSWKHFHLITDVLDVDVVFDTLVLWLDFALQWLWNKITRNQYQRHL